MDNRTPEQIRESNREREKFKKELMERVDRDVQRQKEYQDMKVDYEKFEGMDLENHSIECHFADDQELTDWLRSLNRKEKQYLMLKSFSTTDKNGYDFWEWWLSLTDDEQDRVMGR